MPLYAQRNPPPRRETRRKRKKRRPEPPAGIKRHKKTPQKDPGDAGKTGLANPALAVCDVYADGNKYHANTKIHIGIHRLPSFPAGSESP